MSDDKAMRESGTWYLGSMNDGLFIINAPPRPSTDDVWHNRHDGPTVVLNVAALTEERAQAIVDAHNRAISNSAQSELSRARSEAARDVAGDKSESANALTIAETNCALQALQELNESPRKSSMDVRFDWRSAYALSRLFDRLNSRISDAKKRIASLEAELSRALQPREPAPELAEAEKLLRTPDRRMYSMTSVERMAIAAELDRLRAIERCVARREDREKEIGGEQEKPTP